MFMKFTLPSQMLPRFPVWLASLVVAVCLTAVDLRAVEPPAPVNVVLVHGIYDQGRIFGPLIRTLEQRGCRCFAPSLTPNDGSLGVDHLARQLAVQIDARFGRSAPVVLVGFSLGGIVTRDYVQRLAPLGRVKAVFLISPPNHGTLWASFAHSRLNELGWNSCFLQALNQDEAAWQHIPVCTYWTPFDLMIVPATSSLWPVGDTRMVLCPLHPWMIRNSQLVKDVTTRITGLEQTSMRQPAGKHPFLKPQYGTGHRHPINAAPARDETCTKIRPTAPSRWM